MTKNTLMKFFKKLSLATILVLLTLSPALGDTISGTLGNDTTWTSGAGAIFISGNVTITNKLTISEGTVIKFLGNYSITGTTVELLINGTAANMVTFTDSRDDTIGGDDNGDGIQSAPYRGRWGAVKLLGTSQFTIKHARFRYGGYTTEREADPDDLIRIQSQLFYSVAGLGGDH